MAETILPACQEGACRGLAVDAEPLLQGKGQARLGERQAQAPRWGSGGPSLQPRAARVATRSSLQGGLGGPQFTVSYGNPCGSSSNPYMHPLHARSVHVLWAPPTLTGRHHPAEPLCRALLLWTACVK